MLRTTFFILSLITFSIGSATAAVYKWVDEKGNVHYSEQRPKQSESERIKLDKAPPPSNSSYKRPSAKKDEDEKSKAENKDTKPAENSRLSDSQKQEKCIQARKDLELMVSSGRIRVKDNEGNTSIMSEEEKTARIKRNQDRIKEFCQ